jgi:hypothetical protein
MTSSTRCTSRVNEILNRPLRTDTADWFLKHRERARDGRLLAALLKDGAFARWQKKATRFTGSAWNTIAIHCWSIFRMRTVTAGRPWLSTDPHESGRLRNAGGSWMLQVRHARTCIQPADDPAQMDQRLSSPIQFAGKRLTAAGLLLALSALPVFSPVKRVN